MLIPYNNDQIRQSTYEHRPEDFIDRGNSSSDSSYGAAAVANHEEKKQQLRQQHYGNKILQLEDFNQAFELVKSTVEDKFKMHRAGLSLILQGLPTQLGAYHVLGSNLIIVNKRILEIIKMHIVLGL